MTILKAGTKVFAMNRRDNDVFIVGTTADDHNFAPGALSGLRIATGKTGIPDTFSIEINCNEWKVYELVGKN